MKRSDANLFARHKSRTLNSTANKLPSLQHVPSITSGRVQFSSVAQSCSTLRPHELQHARPPYPSPTAGVYPNPCPLSRWCHPTISSSVIPFSSCLQSFPAAGSFPRSQLFASGGQIIGVSASATILPKNTQDWSPVGWTGWISLQSKGLWRVFSNTRSSPTPVFSNTNKSINFSALNFLYSPTLTSSGPNSTYTFTTSWVVFPPQTSKILSYTIISSYLEQD